MKIKRCQFWRKVRYCDFIRFTYWSGKTEGQGDATLTKESSFKDWRKVIILQPLGNPKTTFSMGFESIFGDTKVSSAVRKVKDGPFGMRMGPDDCYFFIVSNRGEVGLAFVEYADIDEEAKSKITLY